MVCVVVVDCALVCVVSCVLCVDCGCGCLLRACYVLLNDCSLVFCRCCLFFVVWYSLQVGCCRVLFLVCCSLIVA